jgi:hypothetical protein
MGHKSYAQPFDPPIVTKTGAREFRVSRREVPSFVYTTHNGLALDSTIGAAFFVTC